MNPSTKQYNTAIAADSVGVKKPVRMPPMTMMIINSDGTARHSVVSACVSVTRSVALSSSRLRTYRCTTNMHANTHSSPGPMPAMNSAAMEEPLTSEYTMNVLLGGISMPEGAEATLTAAEKLGS